uniref:Bet v I/Major latex protein domain-containing protein n=1 Tax=Fagus sylvatica TaxID=28930 RepID=A0A2N9HG99_FAGSY
MSTPPQSLQPDCSKPLVLDAHNLIPKVIPQVIKSIEIVQGDGGVGSIRQINFAEGSQFKSVKNRIDELNEENYSYKYTYIEGDALADKLESIAFEVQFEPTPEGGSKNKMTSKYHTKADVVLKEEEIKAGNDKTLEIYKILEAYLLQNPDAYV